jgi:hypothetical protein
MRGLHTGVKDEILTVNTFGDVEFYHIRPAHNSRFERRHRVAGNIRAGHSPVCAEQGFSPRVFENAFFKIKHIKSPLIF